MKVTLGYMANSLRSGDMCRTEGKQMMCVVAMQRTRWGRDRCREEKALLGCLLLEIDRRTV